MWGMLVFEDAVVPGTGRVRGDVVMRSEARAGAGAELNKTEPARAKLSHGYLATKVLAPKP